MQSTSNAVITLINAAAGKTITVGNPINGAQDVKGLLNIDRLNTGFVNLTVDNSADPSARTVTLIGTALTGLAGAAIGLDPVAMGNIMLIGGSSPSNNASGNTFNLQAVPASATVTVDAGPGDDVINVGSAANQLSTIAGTLTIDGQAGFNTLTINDQNTIAAQTYTVSNASVDRVGGPNIGYNANIQRLALNAGAGSNTVHIRSTSASA